MKGFAVTTVAEQAADALRRKIMSGELPEGFSLRQDALATEFGISRIPVREALVQLEGEGLVTIVPHKGAVVSGLSIDEISELFMLRSLLEPLLLKKSAPRLTAEDYAQLDAILAVTLGGTSLAGGKFSLVGSMIGALIIQTLTYTIYSLGVPPEVNMVVKSVVVFLVCLSQSSEFKQLLQRRKA